MRFAAPTAAYYCGLDLRARTMVLVVLDQAGAVRLDRNYPARPRFGVDEGCACRR
jgi:hypothetical protein